MVRTLRSGGPTPCTDKWLYTIPPRHVERSSLYAVPSESQEFDPQDILHDMALQRLTMKVCIKLCACARAWGCRYEHRCSVHSHVTTSFHPPHDQRHLEQLRGRKAKREEEAQRLGTSADVRAEAVPILNTALDRPGPLLPLAVVKQGIDFETNKAEKNAHKLTKTLNFKAKVS